MTFLVSKFLSVSKRPFYHGLKNSLHHADCNVQKRHIVSFFRKKKLPKFRSPTEPTKDPPQKEQPYLVVRAKPDDYCTVLQLMWKYYYPEEPTTLALGLGHKYNAVLDDHAMQALTEGLSVLAKCKYTGVIVGASINKTTCPWDPDLMDKLACTFSSERLRKLYHFYAYIMRAPCIWDKYCTNKVFEISQLFVNKDDRGKGVSHLLLQASRDLGADCGYSVIRADATSAFTAKACEKLGMKMVHEIPYCTYTGQEPTHEPIFKPPPPHCACKTYVVTPFLEEQT